MRLEIQCEDRQGLAQEILAILGQHDINLSGIELASNGHLYLRFPDLEFSQLQVLMPQLRRIASVLDVKTVPFIPSEWQTRELLALLAALPDPVLSVDRRGQILLVNQAAELLLEASARQLEGAAVDLWLTGFGFSKHLAEHGSEPCCCWVQAGDQRLLADVLPVVIDNGTEDSEAGVSGEQPTQGESQLNLAGALIRIRSRMPAAAAGNQKSPFEQLIGHNDTMNKLIGQAQRAAVLEHPLLLEGETGTGKELLARACHQSSQRADKQFLVVNCAALPDDVAEHELFGYVTTDGALHKGLLELADGGTLLLDEVGDMSAALQAKLLRFLEHGRFRRIGAEQECYSDVRIIATTQHDLIQRCQQGDFREDLYYRLSVLILRVPPLRLRGDDILVLARHFLLTLCTHQGIPLPKISSHCQEQMLRYYWPGNVRQLENALLRAVTLSEPEQQLTWEMLALPAYDGRLGYVDDSFDGSLDDALKRFESDLLRRLYPAYPSTRQLARKLGISHTAVANKLREYGISKTVIR